MMLTYLRCLQTSGKDAGVEGGPLDLRFCSPALWLPGSP